MNEHSFNLVKGSQARQSLTAKKGAIKQMTPQEELAGYRITPETELPDLEFLFKMFGTACFPVSELVANTGKAKSGKTLFLSIVMACALKEAWTRKVVMPTPALQPSVQPSLPCSAV
jgi:hypothetical protein